MKIVSSSLALTVLTALSAASPTLAAETSASSSSAKPSDPDITMCEAIRIETDVVTKRIESQMGSVARTAGREAGRAVAENTRMQAMSAVSAIASMAGPIGNVLDAVNRTIHGIENKRAALVMAREKAAATMTMEQSASRLVQLSYDAIDHGCPEAVAHN